MGKLTAQQVRSKYRGRYVEVLQAYDYAKQQWLYEVVKSYEDIHENTTLAEDLGTSLEYTR